MAAEWFIAKGDQKLGPVSNKGLRELAANGRILPETLIWRVGLPEWIAASRVENLFSTEPEPAAASAAEEEDDEEPAEPDEGDPPPAVKPALPDAPARPSRFLKDASTERICWWLMLYAKVNFGLSLVFAAPLIGFGLFMMLAGIVGAMTSAATGKDERMVVGGIMLATGMVSAFAEVAAGLLLFLWMNVFTLACAWGAKVLELLKLQSDALRGGEG